jgi:hypothetical protein
LKVSKEGGLFLNNSLEQQKRLAFINATTAKKHGCQPILENHTNKVAKTVIDTFILRTYGLIHKKRYIKRKH